MLPLVMFTGEIADAKVVLHKERKKKKVTEYSPTGTTVTQSSSLPPSIVQ